MKELKFNFQTLLLGLLPTILFVSGYYIFIGLFFNEIPIFDLWFVHLWPILTSLPDIILVSSYLIEDFRKSITVGKNLIVDNKSGRKYESTEIQKIIIHKVNPEYYKIASYMYYQFVEIRLKNNDKLIITSLTKKNIDEFLKENLRGVYFDRDFNNFL